MMPTLIFSCATAGPAAAPSKTASPASFNDCFMLSLRSAAAQPKPTPYQYAQDAAYSDDDRTCKLRRAPCKPCANCLKLKEIWTMIPSYGLFGRSSAELALPRLYTHDT